MKTITLTLTEEQAQQLLQQLLDPNNGNSYRLETAADQDEEPAASSDQPSTPRAYTYKAMDPNGKWWKYTGKPYIHNGPNKPQWISSDGQFARCDSEEIPADFRGDWKDSLMPM